MEFPTRPSRDCGGFSRDSSLRLKGGCARNDAVKRTVKAEVTEKKRVLFPVRMAAFEAIRDWELFDADEGRDLATEIREYYIPDFREWKNHNSYVREFEKLLRDLRTEGARSG